MTINAAIHLLLGRSAARFCFVDVGARWGAHQRWSALNDRADIVCFEPDAEEVARLNESKPDNVHYHPFGLSDTDGQSDLHITAEPACSSVFPPVPALYEHYSSLDAMRPVRTISVPLKRLDDVVANAAVIKLDTQGAELAILRGATRVLATCSLVDVEVEFNPLYLGQPLFCDVDRFMRDQGFVLWRFDNLIHYTSEPTAAARADFSIVTSPEPVQTLDVPSGQAYWAQVQYVRAEYPRTGAEHMSAEEAIPAALVAGAYDFWDLAVELIRKTGDTALLLALREALERASAKTRSALAGPPPVSLRRRIWARVRRGLDRG